MSSSSSSKREQIVDSNSGDTLLPEGFVPSDNDVVCARGKSYWDHPGNQQYRRLIGEATDKYSATTNKLEKTLIVSEIVEAIHNCRNGKFVKKLRKGGPWVEVDEVFAREKVGQSLRDGLHDKYKSSTKAKKQRRTQVNEKFNGDIEKVIFSNTQVSSRIQQLTKEVEKNGALASDYSIITIFSRANSDILESIKKDSSMLNQYQDATVAASAAQQQQNSGGTDDSSSTLKRAVSEPVPNPKQLKRIVSEPLHKGDKQRMMKSLLQSSRRKSHLTTSTPIVSPPPAMKVKVESSSTLPPCYGTAVSSGSLLDD